MDTKTINLKTSDWVERANNEKEKVGTGGEGTKAEKRKQRPPSVYRGTWDKYCIRVSRGGALVGTSSKTFK